LNKYKGLIKHITDVNSVVIKFDLIEKIAPKVEKIYLFPSTHGIVVKVYFMLTIEQTSSNFRDLKLYRNQW
jgi:hypothetical protein